MEEKNDYTERQEGPDDQYCYLLTRVPYKTQRMIEIGLGYARTNNDRMDACLQGMLWGEVSVLDTLTHERTNEIERAGADVIQPWRLRAMDLYNEWAKVAFPGPKGSPRKRGSSTPNGAETASETNGSE